MDDTPQTQLVRYSFYDEQVVDGVYRWTYAMGDVDALEDEED